MIYLHYRSLCEIDLTKIFGTGKYTILIPRITLGELDKHKNSHKLSRIRERARKVTKKIEDWDKGEEVRPGVSAEFLPKVPVVDYGAIGLRPDWQDDVLLASIYAYKVDNHLERVALVTQDTTLRLTARHLGIEVLELPEEYKLPEEPDPLASENRELRKALSRLENLQPKLVMSFAGSENAKGGHKAFSILPPLPNINLEVEKKIEALRKKFPKLPLRPSKDRSLGITTNDLNSMISDFGGLNYIKSAEYERYNKDVDKYLTGYGDYLAQVHRAQGQIRRTIQFTVQIENVGNSPAEDVDIHLHFPNGFRLFVEDELPDAPIEPVLPISPRTELEIMTRKPLIGLRGLDFEAPYLRDDRNPSSFRIERTNSYDVSEHFDKVKQGFCYDLPEMFLVFDSYESASSFSCQYTIYPANLPDPISGELHFSIEKRSE